LLHVDAGSVRDTFGFGLVQLKSATGWPIRLSDHAGEFMRRVDQRAQTWHANVARSHEYNLHRSPYRVTTPFDQQRDCLFCKQPNGFAPEGGRQFLFEADDHVHLINIPCDRDDETPYPLDLALLDDCKTIDKGRRQDQEQEPDQDSERNRQN
jgi:hypothetical protein